MSPPRPEPAGPTLIWAQSTSGVIGRAGGIPWDVPEDMARFSSLTRGHTVVMGRATWESLPERFRPLPRRSNVVLTRQTDYVATGATVTDDPARALAGNDVWVIGGAQVYALALPVAACCEVTEVEVNLRREDDDVPAPVLDGAWMASAGDWQTSSSGLRFRYLRFVRG